MLRQYDDTKKTIKIPKTINKYDWYYKINVNLRKRVY